MTRAKDISKIVTDADLSGTLDVTGTVTAGGLTLAPSQVINLNSGADSFDDIFRNDSENATIINARNNVRINLDSNSDSTSAEFVIGYNGTNTTTAKALSVGESGDISFYEDTGTTPKLFWDASEEALGIGTTTPSTLIHLERGSTGAGGGSNAGITMTNKFDSPDNSWSITPQRTGVSNTGLQIRDETDSRTDMVFDGSGNVGIGTSSPSDKLHIKDASSTNVIIDAPTDNASLTLQCGSSDAGAEGAFINFIQNTTSKWQVGMNTDNTFRWYNYNTSSEAMRIDSSGNVGIGTSSPDGRADIAQDQNTTKFTAPHLALTATGTTDTTGFTGISYATSTLTNYGWTVGALRGTSGANSAFLFTQHNDSASGTERMRIDASGNLLVGKTATGDTTEGFEAQASGRTTICRDSAQPLNVSRTGTDGTLIAFKAQGTEEGQITVSGTTVSYNGGHLARWSRLLDNSKDTTIVKGTVMTNLNEMVEWGDEDNEQLNKMAVSSVEGDANVAGVFVNWDDDDDWNDMNIAMTGDMVIRIAQGITVTRGDLLMSAGDGTAKPQGDDIVRSKTIAKVTSTNVSHTYDDGTYLVPCVLMAC